MALKCTHIRFALDLKDKYHVVDLTKYISGTIYPDSRYITGIDRNLTHPNDLIGDFLQSADDFKKGWAIHLICDRVQGQLHREKFHKLFDQVPVGQGSEAWVRHTALKILQDIDDFAKFNIEQYLPGLAYIENPNGEETSKLKRYNHIFQKMYGGKTAITIDDCCEMWLAFGIGKELVEKIQETVRIYSIDKKITHGIEKIYPESLALAQSELLNL